TGGPWGAQGGGPPVEGTPDPHAGDPWGCLEERRDPYPPITPPPAGILYVVPIVDALRRDAQNPPEGLSISLCLAGDPNCKEPQQPAFGPVDGQPLAVFGVAVPFNFSGYMRLEADGYVTTEYVFGGPMIGGPDASQIDGHWIVPGLEIAPPRPDTMDDWFDADFAHGATREPGKGLLALRTIDCNGKRAAGVRVVSESSGIGFAYSSDGSGGFHTDSPPNDRLTPLTDKYGLAGFANLEPGNVRVQGQLESGVSYGNPAFRIRPDQVTVGELRPDYSYGR
ncbi:hypothetical protein ACFL5O_09655, partial [Myxococcota bacterium]